MKVTKEDLLEILNEFGEYIIFYPSTGRMFVDSIDSKINNYTNRVEWFTRNLDKPFLGKKSLYDFIVEEVGSIDLYTSGVSDELVNPLGLTKSISGIKLPKSKSIDTQWIWDKINKAQDRNSQKISDLTNKLVKKVLPNANYNCYGTTLGISLSRMYNSSFEEDKNKIESFLNKNNIDYSLRFSRGRWYLYFVIGKSSSNIEKLKASLDVSEKRNNLHEMLSRQIGGNSMIRKKFLKEAKLNSGKDLEDSLRKLLTEYDKKDELSILWNDRSMGDMIISNEGAELYYISLYGNNVRIRYLEPYNDLSFEENTQDTLKDIADFLGITLGKDYLNNED